jgi:hypothetical protein
MRRRNGYHNIVLVSKTDKILEHLQTYGSITSWEAIQKYGATRLSAIIFELRKKHRIESVAVQHKDSFGNDLAFSRYVYCGEKRR